MDFSNFVLEDRVTLSENEIQDFSKYIVDIGSIYSTYQNTKNMAFKTILRFQIETLGNKLRLLLRKLALT